MFKTKCNSFVYNIYIQYIYIYNIYIYILYTHFNENDIFKTLSINFVLKFYTSVSLLSQLRALKKPDSNSMCVPQFHSFMAQNEGASL